MTTPNLTTNDVWAVWMDWSRNFHEYGNTHTRFGEFFCNRFDISDPSLLNEKNDSKALGYAYKQYAGFVPDANPHKVPYPQFCLHPEKCAGRSCCPRSYSCSE